MTKQDDNLDPETVKYFVDLSMCVTRCVCHQKQKRITLREHMDSSALFGGVRVAHLLVFFNVFFCFVSVRRSAQCCLCLWILHV